MSNLLDLPFGINRDANSVTGVTDCVLAELFRFRMNLESLSVCSCPVELAEHRRGRRAGCFASLCPGRRRARCGQHRCRHAGIGASGPAGCPQYRDQAGRCRRRRQHPGQPVQRHPEHSLQRARGRRPGDRCELVPLHRLLVGAQLVQHLGRRPGRPHPHRSDRRLHSLLGVHGGFHQLRRCV